MTISTGRACGVSPPGEETVILISDNYGSVFDYQSSGSGRKALGGLGQM